MASLEKAYESVNALLTARRPDEALEVVGDLAAESPDSFDVYFLAGLCHISAGRLFEATEASRRATSLNPDHVGCAILVVRCALSGPGADLETAWIRAEHLRMMAPGLVQARYWIALTAARTRRVEIALAEVAEVGRLDPGGNWPLYAAAEVDLALSARSNWSHCRAKVAEDAVRKLLARDPQDVWAHELRARTAPYVLSSTLRRRVAEVRLGYTRDAAHAGLLPKPGQLRQLTWEAARPAGLALIWALIAFFGAALLNSLGLVATTITLTCIGLLLVVSSWRRTRRVLRTLPTMTRKRFAGPITKTMLVAAAVLGLSGGGALAILSPFTLERAESLNFGRRDGHTETIITYSPPQTFPTFPTFPSIPVPGVPGVPTNIPNIPVPSIPPIPDIRVVQVGGDIDEELAWDLMHYWMYAASSSVIVAASLAVRALTLRRSIA